MRNSWAAEAAKRANHPSFYADTFYVPEQARWAYLRDELHKDVGSGLNKALAALEGPQLTLRTTTVYGPERQGKNFVYQLVRRLRAGRP